MQSLQHNVFLSEELRSHLVYFVVEALSELGRIFLEVVVRNALQVRKLQSPKLVSPKEVHFRQVPLDLEEVLEVLFGQSSSETSLNHGDLLELSFVWGKDLRGVNQNERKRDQNHGPVGTEEEHKQDHEYDGNGGEVERVEFLIESSLELMVRLGFSKYFLEGLFRQQGKEEEKEEEFNNLHLNY